MVRHAYDSVPDYRSFLTKLGVTVAESAERYT